ncbi:unnamed protein product [Parascedosporium putredinis]|uniref:Cytosolic Fe-S cluster assembly factor NBP35 n=1 Tax=Parascedosporium putredinis TaxID=1442378 RepID=A0A9P1H3C7_9PEZI|nr:unnamed protein product [Parascedosporium putredinis]CAI7995036.1 unnamed protein product [Parascedosporium putredinis]
MRETRHGMQDARALSADTLPLHLRRPFITESSNVKEIEAQNFRTKDRRQDSHAHVTKQMAPALDISPVEEVQDVLSNPLKQKPQLICASAPKGPDPEIPLISARLEGVKHKILVLSGKGGVGKSTFTSLLGHAFATNPDTTVGIMDTDICGPSIPKMMGVENETIHISAAGWSPVWVMDNLGVMSIQFMLPNKDDAIIWRVGEMDFLLVDTPPGTSDEHLSVNTFLKESGIDGAVLVTTPQETSLLDVRKEIDFCRKAGIRILGLAENMSGYVCHSCKHVNRIFRATTGGAKKLAEEQGIPYLGAVPLDPRIGIACDYGESYFDSFPDSPACTAFMGVVKGVAEQLGLDIDKVLPPGE